MVGMLAKKRKTSVAGTSELTNHPRLVKLHLDFPSLNDLYTFKQKTMNLVAFALGMLSILVFAGSMSILTPILCHWPAAISSNFPLFPCESPRCCNQNDHQYMQSGKEYHVFFEMLQSHVQTITWTMMVGTTQNNEVENHHLGWS